MLDTDYPTGTGGRVFDAPKLCYFTSAQKQAIEVAAAMFFGGNSSVAVREGMKVALAHWVKHPPVKRG